VKEIGRNLFIIVKGIETSGRLLTVKALGGAKKEEI